MATPSWSISGRYFETCSCDFVCPCILTQMTARPTKGACTFAMTLHIERGSFGHVSLDGIPFIVLGMTPGPMSEGNWSIGLIVDEPKSISAKSAVPIQPAMLAWGLLVFQTTLPVFFSSASMVALGPPGVQMSRSPSMSGDSQ